MRATSFGIPALTVTAALLSGCAMPVLTPASCASEYFVIDQYFDGGQFDACEVLKPDHFVLTIRPEDPPPINPSPWFAFRITPDQPRAITVEIVYEHAAPRYRPKASVDRVDWHLFPEEAVEWQQDRQLIRSMIPEAGITIAAQELLTSEYFSAWFRELANDPAVTIGQVGQSVEGRPLLAAESKRMGDEFIILLGRQHPPELTGTLAMRVFIRHLLGETTLAIRFRQRFGMFIVPLMNPDGVDHGYWRHNVGSVDLNRDWGPFTQSETRAAMTAIQNHLDAGRRVVGMLDFHSTRRDLFYTQIPEESGESPDFAQRWLGLARARLPADYPFEQDARPTSEQPNSKNFFFTQFGIPAITYELGDETDRETIDQVTRVFAEAYMETMLALP